MTIQLHPGAYQMSAMSPKINDEERENKPQCKQGSTSPPSHLSLLSLEAQSTPLWGLRGKCRSNATWLRSLILPSDQGPPGFHSCWVQTLVLPFHPFVLIENFLWEGGFIPICTFPGFLWGCVLPPAPRASLSSYLQTISGPQALPPPPFSKASLSCL